MNRSDAPARSISPSTNGARSTSSALPLETIKSAPLLPTVIGTRNDGPLPAGSPVDVAVMAPVTVRRMRRGLLLVIFQDSKAGPTPRPWISTLRTLKPLMLSTLVVCAAPSGKSRSSPANGIPGVPGAPSQAVQFKGLPHLLSGAPPPVHWHVFAHAESAVADTQMTTPM